MQDYVRSSISILNDVTKELEDLNKLGVYLSKQTNINALKTLKLLILANETQRLNKPFHINYINTYINFKERITEIEHKQKENIAGNLAMNPQNFALELFEYLIKNYPIDLNFECYGIYSIFDIWTKSLYRMYYDEMDIFYKRYDMIDKKLDIFDYLIENGLLTKSQIQELINIYTNRIKFDQNLTIEQKQRMEYKVNQINQYNKLHKHVSSIKNLSKEERDKKHNVIDNIMEISRKSSFDIYVNSKQNAEKEIKNYRMQNDQCVYMLYEIPKLIKQKIIK